MKTLEILAFSDWSILSHEDTMLELSEKIKFRTIKKQKLSIKQ